MRGEYNNNNNNFNCLHLHFTHAHTNAVFTGETRKAKNKSRQSELFII